MLNGVGGGAKELSTKGLGSSETMRLEDSTDAKGRCVRKQVDIRVRHGCRLNVGHTIPCWKKIHPPANVVLGLGGEANVMVKFRDQRGQSNKAPKK